jgi:hypothetical protein
VERIKLAVTQTKMDDEQAYYADMDEYENKPCEVNCIACAYQECASQKELEQRGWHLEYAPSIGVIELCPSH